MKLIVLAALAPGSWLPSWLLEYQEESTPCQAHRRSTGELTGVAHRHHLPSEELLLCRAHGGNWVSGEVAGLLTPSGGFKGMDGTKWVRKSKADAQSHFLKK